MFTEVLLVLFSSSVSCFGGGVGWGGGMGGCVGGWGRTGSTPGLSSVPPCTGLVHRDRFWECRFQLFFTLFPFLWRIYRHKYPYGINVPNVLSHLRSRPDPVIEVSNPGSSLVCLHHTRSRIFCLINIFNHVSSTMRDKSLFVMISDKVMSDNFL